MKGEGGGDETRGKPARLGTFGESGDGIFAPDPNLTPELHIKSTVTIV